LSVPDEGYSRLSNLSILSVPDEGYSTRHFWNNLHQVRSK
jgi:hypothetical protein